MLLAELRMRHICCSTRRGPRNLPTVASSAPSGLQAMVATPPLWPLSSATTAPLRSSHTIWAGNKKRHR